MSNWKNGFREATQKILGHGRDNEDEVRVNYEDRIRRYRIRLALRILATAAAVTIVAVLVILYNTNRTYRNYRSLSASEQEDVVSTGYQELGGSILKYSLDEVSLEDTSLETLWINPHSMQNPMAEVNGNYAVVADIDGTTLEIYDKKGLIGTVFTSYSIVKATISEDGLAAAILDGGEETYINFYSSDGSLIAENQTKIDDPGFPLDLTVSNNGIILMVTYQFVEGGQTTSYVAFYNFGDVGQNEDDRIVSGYTYDGIVIPEVDYLKGNTSIAFREDGFTLFSGSQIPKEKITVTVEEEIISTFHDEDLIGMIFRNSDKDNLYSMRVYNLSGELKFEKAFNIPYTNIRVSRDYILMYNTSQICVMNDSGVTKYSGTVDGNVRDFFKIGWNRYMLVMDTGVSIIKFV